MFAGSTLKFQSHLSFCIDTVSLVRADIINLKTLRALWKSMEIYSGKQKACGIIVLGLYEAPLLSREDLESSPLRFLEGLCLKRYSPCKYFIKFILKYFIFDTIIGVIVLFNFSVHF